MSRFDGAGLVEWVVPLAKDASTLIAAAVGYIAARSGEIEIRRGGELMKISKYPSK